MAMETATTAMETVMETETETVIRRRLSALFAAAIFAPPFLGLPPTGVVTVAESDFGRGKGKFLTPPLATAKEILTKVPGTIETPPILPELKDLNGQVSKDILVEKPRVINTDQTVKIGAAERKIDVPLDRELETKRIFGNRIPIQQKTDESENQTDSGVKGVMTGLPNETRKTGAVSRPDTKQDNDDSQNETTKTDVPSRSTERKVERQEETPPIYSPVERQERPQPRIEPQQRREETKREETKRDEPKYEPPPRQESPKYEPPPRNDPPAPRNDPPPKSDPPPSKSEPSPPMENKKDG